MTSHYLNGRHSAQIKLGLDVPSAVQAALQAGGSWFVAKNALTGAMSRYGQKLAPVRRLGQEIAGVGLRTGHKGWAPMSETARGAVALGVDAKIPGLYDMGHSVGKTMQEKGVKSLDGVPGMLEDVAKSNPAHAKHVEFLQGIPTKSEGWRKGLDYAFKPVNEVGKDIKQLIRPRV